MEFGPVAIADAEGCVLAHSTRVPGATFKKGRVLTSADIDTLAAAGLETVTVARKASDDVDEDAAADRVAHAADGGGLVLDTPFTGRVNLHADHAGLFLADEDAVNAVNRIDPAITLATLPNNSKVGPGRMVATAKIIPFAVGGPLVADAERRIAGALRVAPFNARKIGLVATQLAHLKPATMDKTRRVLEERLRPSGSAILDEIRVPHDTAAVAAAMAGLVNQGAEFLMLFGASAVVDRQDILPAAIDAAGGTVTHFGMPVDPGNLLLLGEYRGRPVIGAPGCARSPKENGFDWVLDRLLAGVPVTPDDITGMGVGGLLMEIETRPQPRELKPPVAAPRVAAIILAAGRSSRMGGPNKLLATLDGKPLVRHVAEAATGAGLVQTVLVSGHMRDDVEAAVADLDLTPVFNPDFADGMAGSIRTGMSALNSDLDAVLILLADMPRITSPHLKTMIDVYTESAEKRIVMATANGKRGNPVLWDKTFFEDLKTLSGDIGARHLISNHAGLVQDVELGSAARLDLDTPEALRAAGGTVEAGGRK